MRHLSSVVKSLASSVAVVAAFAGSASAQGVNLETITVDTQNGERGNGPVTGYVAQQSVTATKTDTPVLETPQSISIVTKDQVAAQQSQTVSEALRYTPGVTVDQYSSQSVTDYLKIRGFDAQVYLDGLRLPVDAVQFSQPKVEPYGLERLEILKGPSSGLYGQTNPGGFLNLVSKRPTDTPRAEVELQTGSYNRKQAAFDASGPIDKNGEFLYRLVGLGRDSDTQTDFVTDRKVFIAPSFTWRPTKDTNLTFLASYQKIDNKGYQQYFPGIGSAFSNPNGQIPYNRYLGEPAADGFRSEFGTAGYEFSHRFNDVFKFQQNFRYTSTQTDLVGTRADGINPDLVTAPRSVNYVNANAYNFAADNNIQADFRTGPLTHKALFGLDYLTGKSSTDFRGGAVAAINVFNPVYGAFVPSMNSLNPAIFNDIQQRQTGIYAQDQIKLDRWTLTLTGRHDRATFATTTPANGATVNTDDSAYTGRAGLTYLFDFGLAPYASYATSFIPTAGTDFFGSPFKPTTGKGKEIGLKYQPTGMNLLFTTSLFEITQQNVLVPDPAHLFFSLQTGEVRVRGFEFEVRGNVTRELEVIGGYTKLDPRVTATTDATALGKNVTAVSLEQATLWGMYTFHNGPLAGLGFGAGARYLGPKFADGANTLTVPGYTLYDAALSYDFSYLRPEMKGLKFQLNAINLSNKYYVSSCFGVTYCSPGAARTVLATLKYQWQ